MTNERDTFTSKDFLQLVERAARAGAAEGAGRSGKGQRRRGLRIKVPWFKLVFLLLIVMAACGAFFGTKNLIENSATHRGNGLFAVEGDVEGKDLTLENYGFLGYVAADFADAILGTTTTPKKLQVYTQDVEETATITDAGLANLVIFSKIQTVTFHGTATYAINLAALNEYCFEVNNFAKTVTMHVPHPLLDALIVPADRIEFGDVERGILAFGAIKLTPEEQAKVQSAAEAQMKQKLLDDKVQAKADEVGKQAVAEVFGAVVSSVAPGYTLLVEYTG